LSSGVGVKKRNDVGMWQDPLTHGIGADRLVEEALGAPPTRAGYPQGRLRDQPSSSSPCRRSPHRSGNQRGDPDLRVRTPAAEFSYGAPPGRRAVAASSSRRRFGLGRCPHQWKNESPHQRPNHAGVHRPRLRPLPQARWQRRTHVPCTKHIGENQNDSRGRSGACGGNSSAAALRNTPLVGSAQAPLSTFTAVNGPTHLGSIASAEEGIVAQHV